MEFSRLIPLAIPFLGAFALSTLSFLILSLLQNRILKYLKAKVAKGTSIKALIGKELFESTNTLFIIVFSIFFGSLFIDLGNTINLLIHKAAFISLILTLGLWANVAINHGLTFIGKHYQQKKGMSAAIFSMIRTLSKAAVWTTLILFILDNLKFQVSTLIAGLGIGGLALALAAQNILQDLFASLSIIIDEPFLIGDLVTIDDFKGHIEYIGIKTTRVRSITGEQIIFSNANLLQSRLRNFKKMEERRVTFILEVIYETPIEKVKKIPLMIKDIISKIQKVRFERAHFKEFGSYSLNFEVVYRVLSADTLTYMDVQQEINEGILEQFNQEKIEFAYPTEKSIQVEAKYATIRE